MIASEYNYASNSITYELARTYFLNGFITEAMKDQVTKHLDNKNRIGGDFSAEMYFRHTPDSMFGNDTWSWTIGMKNVNHFHSTFSRDLFEVYFRGNKNYTGKTADFSDFNYLLLNYQQLQFGISKRIKKDSAAWEAGAALGFNAGQQLLEIQAARADLYTQEIGTYLDLNAKLQMRFSDSLKKKFGSLNGFGISTDFFIKAAIKEKHFFFFKVSNLGFIRWNNRSAEIKADTSFRFEGIDVNDLFTFADTIKTTFTNDSTLAQNFLTQRKYKSYTLLLPAKIEVSYKRPLGHRHMRAGIGVNYIINADYVPKVHFDVDYSWSKNMITFNVSYGGYTEFGAGIFYQHHFNRGYVFMIGSDYINSLFNMNNSRSQHLGITFYRNF